MTFTDVEKITSKSLLFYTNGVKIEMDPTGNMYFNGKAATNTPLRNGYIKASAVIFRIKNPKRVVGVRRRKAALMASLKQYNISLNYIKG